MRFYLLLLGLGLLACLSPRRPRAQQLAAPPAGIGPQQVGRPLRLVAELARVPLPPGGLIPFRQGAYWGYADTTGRVWIEPVLEPEPPFFVGDVVRLSGASLPQFRDPDTRLSYNGGSAPASLPQYSSYSFWLNARGEFLAVDEQGRWPEVALVLPNGHLRAGRAAEHLGEPALTMRYGAAAPQVAPTPAPAPLSQPATRPDPDVVEPEIVQHYWPVGEGRFLYSPERYYHRLVEVHRRRSGHNGHYRYYHAYRFWIPYRKSSDFALVDSAGRLLTDFRYRGAYGSNPHFRFQRGWLAIIETRPVPPDSPPGTPASGLVLLSRQGRVVPLPLAVKKAELGPDGLALAWTLHEVPRPDSRDIMHEVPDLGGIIDTAGRWLLPMTGRLSNPDQFGYLRHAALVEGDTVTRFITRRAEPAFAGNVFRYAGPFYNGRAWVEALDGRQGLIDRTGHWVTPLRYELLTVPTSRRSYRYQFKSRARATPRFTDYGSLYDLAQLPDTAYVLCRRAGKYGYVARHSGREVIPARYDSVVYHLSEGLACLYRGGQPYVVTARGREIAQGEYRGDSYKYPGRPLHLYRPADGHWTVVDTTGRARLPWLPGTGYLAPDGRGVVREPRLPPIPGLDWRDQEKPCSGVVDSVGRVVVTFRDVAGYSGPRFTWPFTSRSGGEEPMPLVQTTEGEGPGSYVVSDGKDVLRLLRSRDLQPLCPDAFSTKPPPNISRSGDGGLHLQPGGWHVGLRLSDGRSVLISPTGQCRLPPPGTEWARLYYTQSSALPGVPFAHHAEKVLWGPVYCHPCAPSQQGYVTPGGRPLWKD